ncbi:MAG: hypothetical protein H6860_05620 [Rhodospirillales bacterium]|nr:hypothetical protein [Rhodospirillales bacterium]
MNFLLAEAFGKPHSESGPHEFFEFIFVGAAFFVAVSTLTKLKYPQQKWLCAWVSLAAICCFYVAGEEVSWGSIF